MNIDIEDFPAALVGVGPDGRVAFRNQRARLLLADSGEIAPGSDWAALMLGDDAARFGRFVTGLAVGATAAQEFQFGPRTQPLRLKVQAQRLPAGFTCALHKAEFERIGPPIFFGQAEVWLPANFLSRLTHELKTHVATAHAALFLLRGHARSLDAGKEQKWLNAVRESIAALGAALEQMDSFERTVTGSSAQGPEPINVTAWLDTIVARVKKAAPSSTVTLELEPGVTGRWWFGELLLGTAVECLLANALKFAPPGGRASIQIKEAGGYFDLVVSDNGPGVAAAEVERLFVPFFQGQNARDLPGCGLGLAIVRAAVTRLAGSVTYHHEPGVGTEFRVRVPARPER